MSEEKSKGNYITVQGLMNKQHKDQQEFINQIGKEEDLINSRESEESINKEMSANNLEMDRKKNQFIDEIKGGLGKTIITNPNRVTILEKSKWDKFKSVLKGIFTKF